MSPSANWRSQLGLALPVAALWCGIGAGFALAREPRWLIVPLAATALMSWWLKSSRTSLLVMLGFAGLGLALIVVRAWAAAPPENFYGQHQITFRVLEDPRTVDSGLGSLNFEREQRFLADIVALDEAGVRGAAVLLSVSAGDWQISEQGICQARIEPASGWQRFRGFARCTSEIQRLSEETRLETFASHVRKALIAATADLQPSAAAALLPGLVLGDESALDAISKAELQAAGLGHLTAVSGANIAILLGALTLLLRTTTLGWRTRLAIQVVAVVAFVVVVRPSPSVVRAAAMALLGIWVVWRGGRRVGGRLLLLASGALLVIDPWLAVSWGFALSVAATAGLIFLSPLVAPTGSSWWRRAVATALSAGLATLPVLIVMGVNPTFASIPANVLAEVFVAPATITGVIAAITASLGWWLDPVPVVGGLAAAAARLSAQLGVWAAAAILWIAERANDSWLAVPVISGLGLLASLVTGLTWHKWRRFTAATLALSCSVATGAVVMQASAQWPPADWQVIGCDVGQGDATLIRAGPESAIVVDAGPDPIELKRCLEQARVREVLLFIATHWHADHVGAVAALSNIGVREVLQPCGVEPSAGQELVRTTFSEVALQPLAMVQPGTSFTRGQSPPIQVLMCPVGEADASDGSSVNNSSLLIAVTLPQGRLLLSGDAESELQEQLMQSIDAGAFAFLKVPHHGSAAVHPAFARWVGAKLGWVSVGSGNDYGHPAPSTLAAYRAAGTRLLTTEQCGDIALTPRGLESARRCQPV